MTSQRTANAFHSLGSRFPRLAALVVGALAIGLFYRVIGFGPVEFDDYGNVFENTRLRAPLLESVLSFWKAPYFSLYVPVTYSVWALVSKISGWYFGPGPLNPFPFHLLNLCLHALNGVLVFRLLFTLLSSTREVAGGARSKHDGLVTASLVGSLFFISHPLQVEPVAWITCLRDLLSTTFALLALQALILSVSLWGWKKRAHYWASVVFFALALLSKPSVSTLALGAVVILYTFCQLPLGKALALCLPWALVAVPVGVITKTLQHDARLAYLPSWWERVLIAGDSLLFYAKKILWPWPLYVDYGRSAAVLSRSELLWVSGVVLLGLLVALFFW